MKWKLSMPVSIPILCLAGVLLLSVESEGFVSLPPAPVEAEFQRMTNALGRGDLAAFLANGTDEAKNALTAERFASVCDQVGAKLKGGFDAVFLTQAKQQGCEVYIWKITPRDGSDDLIIKLALEGGKVAGFRVF